MVDIMKFKTTAKEIRENGYNVVRAGYCDLQYLLRGVEPRAYTCGVYGWNFDVYEIDDAHEIPLTICTGYRGMVGRRAEGIEEYEEKARKIWDYNDKRPYEEKLAAVSALRAEFIRLNAPQ